MNRTHVLWSALLSLAVLGAVAMWVARDLSSFPGRIGQPGYEVVHEGAQTTFAGGEVYRHPGSVPLVEVAGTHYEMGLQYGVLLRPEILAALPDYREVLHGTARDAGVPPALLTAGLKLRTRRMARRLPGRFRDEIRGSQMDRAFPEGRFSP